MRYCLTRLMQGKCAIALALLAALAFAQTVPDLGFSTKVSASLTTAYTRRFGPAVPERFAAWKTAAKAQKAAPLLQRLDAARGTEAQALQAVNDIVNTPVKWVDDLSHWKVADYWATPAETYGSAGGDCEDFSIAKYYLLKELGVPIQRLRITYVRAMKLQGQAHMVLAYYATPDAEPLILDNLEPRVLPASQRADLEPVYSFNDDEMQIVQGGKRTKPSQIRTWLALQERLLAESRT